MFERVFLLVLDGCGVGEAPDADKFGDKGANTLLHTLDSSYNLDVLERLGLTTLLGYNVPEKRGMYMKAHPYARAKDSLNGHYELMGTILKEPYKTYPEGFPNELIERIQASTGYDVIGNICGDGHEIINELGEMQIKTGSIIIYTSADSVLQVAAHEDTIPLETLYKICEKIRVLASNSEYNISRIIARPFYGKLGEFVRNDSKRMDYTLDPPINVLDILQKNNIPTIGMGKIPELFNNKGFDVMIKTHDNIDTMLKVVDFSKGKFSGLLFANLNDFDTIYGHRRDKKGYLEALEEFNYYLPILLKNLKKSDLLIITSDHGNDPTFKGTDHTREDSPVLIYSPIFKKSKRMNDRETLADVGATILDNFNIKNELGVGTSIFSGLR
jgi:phosphopentomutase